MDYSYKYPRMQVTCDVLVTWRHYFLAIERKNEPFQGMYALPGGFVNMGEHLETGAIRELREETDILVDAEHLAFIGMYDDIKRDPRDRTISALFHYHFPKHKPRVKAGDDAVNVAWLDVFDIIDGKLKLAFDHEKMVNDVFNLKFVNQ